MHLQQILADLDSLLAHWKTSPVLKREVEKQLARPVVGGEYVHSKTGNRYTVLGIALYCGEHKTPDDLSDPFCRNASPLARGFPAGSEIVVYVGHYYNTAKPGGNRLYSRPIEEWSEEVEIPGAMLRVPRFVPADAAKLAD